MTARRPLSPLYVFALEVACALQMMCAASICLAGCACLVLVVWRLDLVGIAAVCLWVLPAFSAWALDTAWRACRLLALTLPPEEDP